jgi:hypothetical protein
MPRHTNAHNTQDEIDFIKKLGTCRNGDQKSSRIKLLKKYLNRCAWRDEWGQVDKNIVVRFVEHEIAELTGAK